MRALFLLLKVFLLFLLLLVVLLSLLCVLLFFLLNECARIGSVGLSVTVERARDVFVVFDVLLLLCVFLLLLLLSNMGAVGGEEMLC